MKLQIGDENTTAKDVQEIVKTLCEKHPGITIKEYLQLQNKQEMTLV